MNNFTLILGLDHLQRINLKTMSNSMRKNYEKILFMLLAIFSIGNALAIDQLGIAYRYNGKKQRSAIGGVYVKVATSPNGVVSNEPNGQFVLKLKGIGMGDPMGLATVTKKGMMVFNKEEVDRWSVQKKPLVLIVCDANEFQKQKDQLIAIGRSQAEKKYKQRMAKLEAQNAKNLLTLEQYYAKLDSIEKEKNNALAHMDEYADLFARIDESEIDTIAQKAVDLFKQGYIDEAITLFKKNDPIAKIKKSIRIRKQAEEMRQLADSADALAQRDIDENMKNAKAYIAALKLKNDWEEAGRVLKELADALGTFEAIGEYAEFALQQNQFTEAETYYKLCKDKIAVLVKSNPEVYEPRLAAIYITMGLIYNNTQRFNESEQMHKAALDISKRLADSNPQAHEPFLAASYISLAILYSNTQRFTESEKMYGIALKIFKRLADANPQAYEPPLATSYISLANLYSSTQRFTESEKMYGIALGIFKRLVDANPQAYEPPLATSYSSLANLYSNTQRFTESEKMYGIALDIFKRLVDANPLAYEPPLAASYISLANLYSNIQRFTESEQMYKAALEIRKRLADANPQAYEPELATSYNNLANLYMSTRRFAESEKMHKAAVEIRKRLADANPQAYEPDLAQSYNNLANLYSATQRFAESEKMHKAAVEIRKRLADANPQACEPNLAQSYHNLANLYSDTQRFTESEKMYKAALKIRKRLAEANPQAYEPDLAGSYSSLAYLYSNTQRFTESEQMYKAALEICKRLSDANPQAYEPRLADSYNNLANLYSDTQRHTESEQMYKAALEIFKRLVDANPQAYEPNLAISYNNLANLYYNTQRYTESELMHKSALEILERLADANPQAYEPNLAISYNNLADLYSDTQRYAESEQMYKAAIAIYERLYEGAPQLYQSRLAAVYYLYGMAMLNNNKHHDAIAPFERSLKLCKDLMNEETGKLLYVGNLAYLVDLYSNDKDYETAYTYNKELLPLLKTNYGEDADNWKTDYHGKLISQSFYANLLGKFEEGELHSLEALKVDSTQHLAYTNLAAAYLLQGKYQAAEKLYRQYKNEFKDGLLTDFDELAKAGVIPVERLADVEKIKKMLNE